MGAFLRYHEKYSFKRRYVIEMTLHEVPDDKRYPLGVKYGFICIDLKTGNRVLMDNHHPKNDHYHLNDDEFDYEFVDIDRLIKDFRSLVYRHLGVKL